MIGMMIEIQKANYDKIVLHIQDGWLLLINDNGFGHFR